ncbi:MAG: HAMP domain-containing protein [Acidobacteriia bacterium]|nr:HAMP domain-containing protein [Terriglobia bacterium]
MGPFFHNLRLRTKIIATVTVVMISVLAVSTYIGHFFIQLPVEEDQYHRAVELTFSNSDRFARRGIFRDPASLAQEFQIIQRDHQDVLAIAVYTHGPRQEHSLVLATPPVSPLLELDAQPMVRQMFEYDNPFEGVQSIETGSGKSLSWIVSAEIIEGGHPVGCLNLKVSKYGINVVSRQMIKYNVAVLLLAILAIVALLSLLFSRLVNKPIERLLEAMEQAEAGALNTRVDVHRDDELGTIASRFNRMMDRVTALNEELSTRVAEATEELRERNIELTRINEELFETQRMLARSERLAIAGQLAASLAHEIGTPLNAISGHVQLLTKTLAPEDEAARKRLKIIETQIDHIVRVVKDLLASTRDITLSQTPADLTQFLEEILLFATPTLDMKGIHVETAFDRTLPRVLFDALRLQQVFLNLINNSIDAMPNGGTLRLRTFLSRNSKGEGVAGIEYSDTGGGITKENLSRIFEPTFTTKRIGSGAGFGLAISKQIMKAHGGTISAESPEGGGARFILELPLAVAEPTYAESLEHSRR